MRMIPSNVMGNLLGLGYDVDSTNYYTSTALDYKCIGFWKFDDLNAYSGQPFEVKNDSPYGVDGQLSDSGATHSTANQRVDLSSVANSYIDFGNNYNLSYGEPFSIYLKFMMPSTQPVMSLFSKYDQNKDIGWEIRRAANDVLYFRFACSSHVGGSKQFFSKWDNGYTTGTTYSIVWTYDGAKTTNSIGLFLNGLFTGSFHDAGSGVLNTSNVDADSMNNQTCRIGANGFRAAAQVRIYEAGIWSRVLNSTNVSDLYNGGTGGAVIPFHNHVPDVAYMAHLVKMELAIDKYYTDADINIVYDDGTGNQTYTSIGLEVPAVEYSASPAVDKITLVFDNVSQEFSQIVLGQEVRGKTVKVWLAALNAVPKVVGKSLQFQGIIDSVEITREKAVFHIFSHMYLWQKKIPKRRHSSRCNWTFKDSGTCQYPGVDSVCDKSWDDCLSKSNTVNFGGFRWLPSLVDQRFWWGEIPNDGR